MSPFRAPGSNLLRAGFFEASFICLVAAAFVAVFFLRGRTTTAATATSPATAAASILSTARGNYDSPAGDAILARGAHGQRSLRITRVVLNLTGTWARR